jgi:hypothetical protein
MAAAAKRQAELVTFDLGYLFTTPGALRALVGLGMAPIQLIARHAAGDWGDLCEEDRQVNAQALADGSRLLSAYEIQGAKFWVITEADRSATTVLLPSEY